jgi:hypothetical protein
MNALETEFQHFLAQSGSLDDLSRRMSILLQSAQQVQQGLLQNPLYAALIEKHPLPAPLNRAYAQLSTISSWSNNLNLSKMGL